MKIIKPVGSVLIRLAPVWSRLSACADFGACLSVLGGQSARSFHFEDYSFGLAGGKQQRP